MCIRDRVWYAFGATTLYDLGTHITTTFKDISRDREHGITTTPVQLGIRPALFLSAAATILAFVVALLPYWLEDPLIQKSYAVCVILNKNIVTNNKGRITASEMITDTCAPMRHGKNIIEPIIDACNAK